MTVWNIKFEVTIPTANTEPTLGDLRTTLMNDFVGDKMSLTENSSHGLTRWGISGKIEHRDFNAISKIVCTAHQDSTFLIYYTADDLLSGGHALWSDGELVFNEQRENLTYEQYRACGFDSNSWMALYVDGEEQWQEIIDNVDSSDILLSDLFDYLAVEYLFDDYNEFIEGIDAHPNYNPNTQSDFRGQRLSSLWDKLPMAA